MVSQVYFKVGNHSHFPVLPSCLLVHQDLNRHGVVGKLRLVVYIQHTYGSPTNQFFGIKFTLCNKRHTKIVSSDYRPVYIFGFTSRSRTGQACLAPASHQNYRSFLVCLVQVLLAPLRTTLLATTGYYNATGSPIRSLRSSWYQFSPPRSLCCCSWLSAFLSRS